MPLPIDAQLLSLAVQANPGVWFETEGRIRGVSGRLESPRMNIVQRRINAAFIGARKRGRPVRIIGLKPRKRGFSTMVSAIHHAELCKHSFEGVVVGNKLDTSSTVMRMMKVYAENDAFLKRGEWGSAVKAGEEKIAWTHGSLCTQSTAMGSGSIRGQTPQFVHGCVPPGTPVIVEDGKIVPIEEVQVGTAVFTHSGARAIVTACIGQPNYKGEMLRITPWLGDAICFTKEHKIPTRRGVIEAQDVTEDDELCLPIRVITHTIKRTKLPATKERSQHGGRGGAGAGASLALTEDVGFACGYYLAEGSVFGRGDYIVGVNFTRHRFEADYAEKACGAFRRFFTTRRTDMREGTQATNEACYGAPIAQWLAAEFGRGDGKRIPDWVFNAGEAFCRGLLRGLLCGDGSKGREKTGGYDIARMVLTATRSSLASQARDIAGALGYGWASIRSKDAGRHYGRNCKKVWRVVWTGEAARKLRSLIGASEVTGGRRHIEKYRIADGRVWIKVRKIERGIEVPYMWDLSVDHPDHTFRTPSFAIGNTEMAHWEGEEETFIALMNAIPDTPESCVFLESTPKGQGGRFFEMWQGARWPDAIECPDEDEYWRQWAALCPQQEDDSLSEYDFVRVFAAWFEFEEAASRLDDAQKDHIRRTLDAKSWYYGEKALIEAYGRTREDGSQVLGREVHEFDVWEQLAWRRQTIKTKCKGDPRVFDQEYPRDPESCFLASGNPVFDADAIAHLQSICSVSPRAGQIDRPDEQSLRAVWRECDPDDATFQCWETPRIGCRYIIPVDTAEGNDQTKGDDPDRHSVPVLRAPYIDANGTNWRMKVVARVKPPCRMPIHALVGAVHALSLFYGNAIVIPEMNNTGLAFLVLAKERGMNLWKRVDINPRSGKKEEKLGWRTTDTADYGGLRTLIIERLGEVLREKAIDIHCPHIVGELAKFVDNEGRKEAGRGAHDDDVLSLAIGVYNIEAASAMEQIIVPKNVPPDLARLMAMNGDDARLAMRT